MMVNKKMDTGPNGSVGSAVSSVLQVPVPGRFRVGSGSGVAAGFFLK